MKTRMISKLTLCITMVMGLYTSCSDSFLDQPPLGSYSEVQLANKKGVNGLLINAYATLDGTDGTWGGGASNWLWGSMRSGDAYKGSESTDQPPMTLIEKYEINPSFGDVQTKWNATFDGIASANAVLVLLQKVEDLTDDEKKTIEAEARFLRAHHHFEGVKLFKNIPWVDETVANDAKPTNIGVDVWSKIEEDFKFGYDNLPAQMNAKGRANKWAAAAYLAKAHMFQAEWAAAETILDDIIANGTNAQGVKLALNDNYQDNFVVSNENSKEAIFSIQFTVGVGTTGRNANYDGVLNYPHTAGPGGCCGFFQPSHNLVNSYKTDASGLPLLDTYNDVDFVDPANNFVTVYAGSVDPRLDHTVGRKDVPYLDWGPHPGASWIRKPDFGGPYSPKKNVYKKAEEGSTSEGGFWGERPNGNNFTIIRYADVLLWKAEAAIEQNDLADGLTYINMVRERAANPASEIAGSPTAYNVGLYTAFATQAEAREALQFERKLEFGMEGHRFFDLVRWHENGQIDMIDYINNEYLAKEVTRRPHLTNPNPTFTACDMYLPIPAGPVSQSFVDGEAQLKQISGCF
jgi:starch-binding outer membrane protein, SusD/RagB family